VAAAVMRHPIWSSLSLPLRTKPRSSKWRWVTWGSVFAAVIWLAGSLLHSWYVGNFVKAAIFVRCR
jgi:membrane protein